MKTKKKKPNLFKRLETIWLAKEVKKEIENFHSHVDEVVKEFGYDKAELLNFPKWPFVIKTATNEFVCHVDAPGEEPNLLLFFTADKAEEARAMYIARTGKECSVVQPEHNFPFKKNVVIMYEDCGFQMWYGTYRSIYHLQTVKSMEATGLL